MGSESAQIISEIKTGHKRKFDVSKAMCLMHQGTT